LGIATSPCRRKPAGTNSWPQTLAKQRSAAADHRTETKDESFGNVCRR
jgi:hypothetical protein